MSNEALFSRAERVGHSDDDAPHNIPIPQLAEETGISDVTLYNLRKQARAEEIAVPTVRHHRCYMNRPGFPGDSVS